MALALQEEVQPSTRVTRRVPWMVLSVTAAMLLIAALIYGLYVTVPKSNEGDGPVDVLLVLGTPAGLHGELTEMQRWRVEEAVREFRKGRAPRILFTGGPTSQSFVEADVMRAYALRLGIPDDALLEDRRAMTTVQNIAFSAQILHAHGWQSVEVISTEQHLPRAAVLLGKTDLRWRTHVAPTPDRGWADTVISWVEEAIGTAALRIFGTRAEPFLHFLARGQHGLSYGARWVLYRVQDRLRR